MKWRLRLRFWWFSDGFRMGYQFFKSNGPVRIRTEKNNSQSSNFLRIRIPSWLLRIIIRTDWCEYLLSGFRKISEFVQVGMVARESDFRIFSHYIRNHENRFLVVIGTKECGYVSGRYAKMYEFAFSRMPLEISNARVTLLSILIRPDTNYYTY
jgi:hypothetical protein